MVEVSAVVQQSDNIACMPDSIAHTTLEKPEVVEVVEEKVAVVQLPKPLEEFCSDTWSLIYPRYENSSMPIV